MNYGETASVLGLLALEYRNETIDEPRIELWTELFRDVDYQDAKDAAIEWFREAERGRFFPRPAELRSLVRSTKPALDSALYGRYAVLRRRFQVSELNASEGAELDRIERKLGIAKLPGIRDQPRRELAISLAAPAAIESTVQQEERVSA